MARRTLFPALLLLPLAAACAGDRPASPLEGEWHARFQLDSPAAGLPAPARRVAEGTIVISPRLPDYADAENGDTHEKPGHVYTPGRHFTDFVPLILSADSLRTRRPVRTPPHVDDIMDEAASWVDPSGQVELLLTPHVTHVGVEMRGTLRGDSIGGRWRLYGGNPVLNARGRFQMWRVPRTEAWDSAHSRARRARDAWEREARTGVRP